MPQTVMELLRVGTGRVLKNKAVTNSTMTTGKIGLRIKWRLSSTVDSFLLHSLDVLPAAAAAAVGDGDACVSACYSCW